MCFSSKTHLLHSINHVFLGLLPLVSSVRLSVPFVSARAFSFSFFTDLAVSSRLSEETSLQRPRKKENVNTHIVILAHLEDLREGQRSKDAQLGRGKDDTERRH